MCDNAFILIKVRNVNQSKTDKDQNRRKDQTFEATFPLFPVPVNRNGNRRYPQNQRSNCGGGILQSKYCTGVIDKRGEKCKLAGSEPNFPRIGAPLLTKS